MKATFVTHKENYATSDPLAQRLTIPKADLKQSNLFGFSIGHPVFMTVPEHDGYTQHTQ